MAKAVWTAAMIGVSLSVFAGDAAFGQANGYAKIDAQFQIIGKDAIDPPPGQKKDRVALFLEGAGAKKIYTSMPASSATKDVCEQGGKVKKSGALECWESHGEYTCRVAILLDSGQSRPIEGC